MRQYPIFIAVAVTVVAAAVTYTDSRRYSTGTIHFVTGDAGCVQEGVGGDPWLNALKNRDALPQNPSPALLTIPSIIGTHPNLVEAAGRAKRAVWSAAARAQVKPYEEKLITAEGYMLMARDEGKEACNCGSTTHIDTHTWLAVHATDSRATASVVAEVSPRMKIAHPNWNHAGFAALISHHTKLRVTGWMMWDQEHPDQVGHSRGTCWEVHPIHRIQYLAPSGIWKDF